MEGRLPNFLIAGAMKSGTTSLSRWLAAHPDVFVVPEKEVEFFDSHPRWAHGIDWYAARFAGAYGVTAVGEASPNYMYFPWAVERIAETLPGDARVICCLREPVARAHSHYLHWRDRRLVEQRTLAQALSDELDAWPNVPAEDTSDVPYWGYLARGRYFDQLERLERYLGRDRMHVVLLDDLERDPQGTFAAACRFLGVDDTYTPPNLGSRENPASEFPWMFRFMVRHRLFDRLPQRTAQWLALGPLGPRRTVVPDDPIDPQLAERLARHFDEPNRRLSDFLHRDLAGWSRST